MLVEFDYLIKEDEKCFVQNVQRWHRSMWSIEFTQLTQKFSVQQDPKDLASDRIGRCFWDRPRSQVAAEGTSQWTPTAGVQRYTKQLKDQAASQKGKVRNGALGQRPSNPGANRATRPVWTPYEGKCVQATSCSCNTKGIPPEERRGKFSPEEHFSLNGSPGRCEDRRCAPGRSSNQV